MLAGLSFEFLVRSWVVTCIFFLKIDDSEKKKNFQVSLKNGIDRLRKRNVQPGNMTQGNVVATRYVKNSTNTLCSAEAPKENLYKKP